MRQAVPVAVVLLLMSFAGAGAQTLYVAPAESESDRISMLTMRPGPPTPLLDVRTAASADTNVLPLLRSGDRGGAARTFTGSSAYFASYRDSELGMTSGQWRLCYAYTEADLYNSNADGAQVYLDSITSGLNPNQLASPQVTMNRTSALRWRAAYTTPIRRAPVRGTFRIAANYLRMQRVQLGTLDGTTNGDAFHGTLTFQTTLDQKPADTRSCALGIDMGTVIEINPRWRTGVFVDNLWSKVRERALQSIVSTVSTNTIDPNGDGFLNGVPLLQGTVGTAYLNAALQRRVDVATAYREGARDWMLLYRSEHDQRVAAGVTARQGRDGQAWGLLWLNPFEVQLGVDSGSFRLEFGTSSLDAWRAERAILSLSYRIALGHTR